MEARRYKRQVHQIQKCRRSIFGPRTVWVELFNNGVFCFTSFFDVSGIELEQLINNMIMGIEARATRINASTFEVLRMCYACVVYHREFLIKKLDCCNRLRACAALTHMPEVSYIFIFIIEI